VTAPEEDPPADAQPTHDGGELTRRERELVTLVAQGGISSVPSAPSTNGVLAVEHLISGASTGMTLVEQAVNRTGCGDLCVLADLQAHA
jgi:hypothetical protein